MKVCNRCGIEIDTIDGDNYCPDCDSNVPPDEAVTRDKVAREAALEELGLVKVIGALGGTYWE